MAWVGVGLIAAMSEVSWLPTVFTILLTGSAIYRGKVSFIPAMPIAFFFSLLVGLGNDANFVDLNSGEIFGWSAIATAFFTLSLSAMEMTDWLYSKCDEVDNEIEKWGMFSKYFEKIPLAPPSAAPSGRRRARRRGYFFKIF